VTLARWSALLVLGACAFPERSERYACETNADCDSGRTCDSVYGYCVKSKVDAGISIDAGDGGTPPIDSTVFMDANAEQMLAMKCTAAGYTLATGANGYYRVVTGGQSWTNAQTDCANDVAGSSHLIVLSTPAEVTYMAGQLGWVGLSDRTTEGQFVNVTGETPDQRPWANGQPDNGSGSEDCAQMKSGGQLDDDQCDNAHRYVCECDGKSSSL
jgi:hypothetical protein